MQQEAKEVGLLEEAIEIENLKGILDERELPGDAARSSRSRALEEAIDERALGGRSWSKGSCGGMQQEVVEVEHLNKLQK